MMLPNLEVDPDFNPRVNEAVDRGPDDTWSHRTFLVVKAGAVTFFGHEYRTVRGWVRGHLGIYRPTWNHPRNHKGSMAGCSWALVHLPTGQTLFEGSEMVEECRRTGYAAGGWRWYSLRAWAEHLERFFDADGALLPGALEELEQTILKMCNDKAIHGQDQDDPTLEKILEDIYDKKPSYAA
jgi:hypothetical protein